MEQYVDFSHMGKPLNALCSKVLNVRKFLKGLPLVVFVFGIRTFTPTDEREMPEYVNEGACADAISFFTNIVVLPSV